MPGLKEKKQTCPVIVHVLRFFSPQPLKQTSCFEVYSESFFPTVRIAIVRVVGSL